MTRTTNKIRRMLTAVTLSAAAALLVVPLGHAGNTAVDDWFRDAKAPQAQAGPQPLDLKGDFMFQQYFRDAAKANDHILDVSARDQVQAPATPSSDHVLDVSARDAVLVPAIDPKARAQLIRDEALNRLYQHTTPQVDPRARAQLIRDEALNRLYGGGSSATASVASDPAGGTDWGEIGVGIALTLGGALLLVVLVAVGVEVRHSRHRLRSV